MELIDIISYGVLVNPLTETPVIKTENKVHKFPTMYALSKTGATRVYEIEVEDLSDHAILTTKKKVTINGKYSIDKYEYWEGVNIGKANETTYLEQALFDAKSSWNKLKDAGFKTTLPQAGSKFNTDKNGKIKPMLAIGFCEKKIVFPCLCQPKYDGVRCTISEDSSGINIISRKGKTYNIPHINKWAEQHRHLLPLDGELYNHKELTFEEIVSAVKKLSDITDKIRYVVYDRPVDEVKNLERWNELLHDFEPIKDGPVYLSTYRICNNIDEVFKYHDECVAQGYEGVIIRNFDGLYEFGFRSNNLIKYKEFKDDEYTIADVVEASGRDAGTAIFVLYLHGHEGEEITSDNSFKAKPQGTREVRTEYLNDREILIGKQSTIRYQELTDEGKPRFPSAVAVRDYE